MNAVVARLQPERRVTLAVGVISIEGVSHEETLMLKTRRSAVMASIIAVASSLVAANSLIAHLTASTFRGVLSPERAFVPADDFPPALTARDDLVGRFALLTDVDCDTPVGSRAATTTARSASATRSSTTLLQQNAPDFRSPSCGIGPFSSAAFVFQPFQSRAGAKRWGGSRFQQNGNRSNMSSMSGDLGRLTCSDLLWL